MAKTPETTIATLDLGKSCMLTLTNRHLRGQITKYVVSTQNGKQIKTLQKDSLDVLLSGIAGYSLDFQDKKGERIVVMVVGVLVAILGIWLGATQSGAGFLGIPVGALIAWFGRTFPRDMWLFAINVMGGKNEIPVAAGHGEQVREFITKLQNAKIAYEEQDV